ncbi:unnamed protein product [Clavelina lepadiformis]|uniref:Uncharacterized protein n=1 Tax=Clavelina lepadiformis TaxID=159417 RepID=A0ABP0GBS8_CLALP
MGLGAPRIRAKEKRTKNVERNSPGAASLSKDSTNHDPNEQQLKRKNSRWSKREVTNEESSDSQEKLIIQRSNNSRTQRDFSHLPLDETVNVRCVCSEVLTFRRSANEKEETTPDFDKPVFCTNCNSAYIRCHCTEFSIQCVRDRYCIYRFDCCHVTYKPNKTELNLL